MALALWHSMGMTPILRILRSSGFQVTACRVEVTAVFPCVRPRSRELTRPELDRTPPKPTRSRRSRWSLARPRALSLLLAMSLRVLEGLAQAEEGFGRVVEGGPCPGQALSKVACHAVRLPFTLHITCQSHALSGPTKTESNAPKCAYKLFSREKYKTGSLHPPPQQKNTFHPETPTTRFDGPCFAKHITPAPWRRLGGRPL